MPRVQELPGAEELTGERLAEEPLAVAARAVEEEDGVLDHPGRVPHRGAERGVVEPQLGQDLAAREVEVVEEAAPLGGRLRGRRGCRRGGGRGEEGRAGETGGEEDGGGGERAAGSHGADGIASARPVCMPDGCACANSPCVLYRQRSQGIP